MSAPPEIAPKAVSRPNGVKPHGVKVRGRSAPAILHLAAGKHVPLGLADGVRLRRFADQLLRFALVGGIGDLDLLRSTVRSAIQQDVFAQLLDEDLCSFLPVRYLSTPAHRLLSLTLASSGNHVSCAVAYIKLQRTPVRSQTSLFRWIGTALRFSHRWHHLWDSLADNSDRIRFSYNSTFNQWRFDGGNRHCSRSLSTSPAHFQQEIRAHVAPGIGKERWRQIASSLLKPW